MAANKSRTELEMGYGRRDVEQSLVVWSALTRAVENNKTIADIVVGAKALSEAWKILKSNVDDDITERTKEKAKKSFEELSMENAESMKEYVARVKFLALTVKYHGVEVTEQEISSRVLNSPPPAYASEKRNFALKTYLSLGDLEDGLVRVEELTRSLGGTDGSHALAAGFKARSGGQSGRCGGRGGRNGDRRGKRDGKGRLPNLQRQNHYRQFHSQQ